MSPQVKKVQEQDAAMIHASINALRDSIEKAQEQIRNWEHSIEINLRLIGYIEGDQKDGTTKESGRNS